MRILYGALLLLAVTACGKTASTDETPALKDAYEGAFLIGAAMNLAQINGEDQQGLTLIKTHFNSITPENHTKWENIHPNPDAYTFEAADKFVEFGEQHAMFMVGHPLVWHSQTPKWVF